MLFKFLCCFKLGLILPAGVPQLFSSLLCDVARNIACLAKQANEQKKALIFLLNSRLIFRRCLNESLHRSVNKTSPENLDETKLVLGISLSLTNKVLTR